MQHMARNRRRFARELCEPFVASQPARIASRPGSLGSNSKFSLLLATTVGITAANNNCSTTLHLACFY